MSKLGAIALWLVVISAAYLGVAYILRLWPFGPIAFKVGG